MPIELEKFHFHSNFHKIRLKNYFFIAINVLLENNLKRSNFFENKNFAKRITPQCSPMIILYVVKLCALKKTTPCIHIV